jgi:broad specificity polyphosphatase/5'/3'-nucleotidase SurE
VTRQERLDSACLIGILITLLLLAGSYLPNASAAQQPATTNSPIATAAAPASDQRPTVTAAEATVWAEATLAGAGVVLPESVSLVFSDVANCGANLSTAAIGGCTYRLAAETVIVISPSLAWTEAGSHILFHEVAHALGISDECAAEEWAHQFEDAPYWSYPECNVY